MRWEKKNPSFTTIEQVIEYNSGTTVQELLFSQENDEDPYLFGLDQCVNVVRNCIEKGMEISVVGDYDADGVTSTTILSLGLEEITGKKPEIHIPKRFSEGYGLNISIVDKIPSHSLMITVDNGIAAVEQIHKAKEKGIVVVIIDHHIKRDDGKIPCADAVLDPCAVDGSDYTHYCGAGLAYRFIKALNPNTKLDKKLIALAGIGTVADVMILRGANRYIVKQSLKQVKEGYVTYGLFNLLQAVDMPVEPTATDYGFKIGPCINASGRLYDDGGERVYSLLSKDCVPNSYEMFEMQQEVRAMAQEIIDTNERRKELVFNTMQTVDENMKYVEKTAPIIYYQHGLHEGIVGIIAGKLAEKNNMPATVLTDSTKEGVLKGSGRSVPEVHLKELLDRSSKYLLGYGGHAGAAGLSLLSSNLEAFSKSIKADLAGVNLTPADICYYDLEITEAQIPQMAEYLKRYEPFGEGCSKVRFLLRNYTASPKGSSHYVIMGSQKNHVKIIGNNISLMGFGMAKRYEEDGFPANLDVIGELGINYYNNQAFYQMEIIDYKIRNTKTKAYSNLANMLNFI